MIVAKVHAPGHRRWAILPRDAPGESPWSARPTCAADDDETTLACSKTMDAVPGLRARGDRRGGAWSSPPRMHVWSSVETQITSVRRAVPVHMFRLRTAAPSALLG